VELWKDFLIPRADRIHPLQESHRQLPFRMTTDMTRRLQDQSDFLDGCDIDWYSSDNLTDFIHLWPIWKTEKKAVTALSPEVIRDICVAEDNTQRHLEMNGLCFGCEEGCLPPYSIVLYARLTVTDGIGMTCQELRDAWAPYQATTEQEWKTCVEDIKATYTPNNEELPESCPSVFSPTIVDEFFDETSVLVYTSSIFATEEDDVNELYDAVDSFDRESDLVTGVYDTQDEDFVEIYLEDILTRDMALAMGSAVVVAIAIVVHTRSPFITFIGLIQIILSFPLAYFVYKIIAGLEFFPFLNFIGIFVVFALGADDIFVVVDKWKNVRLEHPKATTEYIAALALPDAALAMFLTTITTAIAFFATAICPVAPVKMFAIFLGLLIIFDYIMNILLVFPALCIYDKRLQQSNPNCCISCNCCGRCEDQSEPGEDGQADEKPSLIRRILTKFYNLLHRIRWGLLVACAVGLVLSAYYTSTLGLPTSSDVRLLTDSNEFEQNYLWRQHLLYDVLEKSSGSIAHVIWGVKPGDTGDHSKWTSSLSSWNRLSLLRLWHLTLVFVAFLQIIRVLGPSWF
jgi:preprotein translocase subunit SecF